MTYSSRGRSLTELIIAVIFVCFLTGFVAALCIGNYYRAKRAVERQKQRRLARLTGLHFDSAGDASMSMSPHSHSTASDEQMPLMRNGKLPDLPRRRQPVDDGLAFDLLLSETTSSHKDSRLMSV